MSVSKEKNILNLVEQLSDFFKDYLDKNQFVLYEREQVQDIENLGYIIVSDIDHAKEISKEYNTNKNKIEIICFAEKNGLKDFLLSNGRFLISSDAQNNFINKFILDKYFSQNSNIHMDENLGEYFDDVQRFNIINHLITGEFIDEVSLYAFEKNHNLVSIRSFIDHLIYYFSYLKQSGLAGIPFEFEYSGNTDLFVLNVNVSVKNFVAEYVIDSFGQMNSSKPLDYLVGVITKSCDFMDITYIEDPGKLSFTGYFSSNDFVMKGVNFSNIKTATQIKNELDLKINSFSLNKAKDDLSKERKDKLDNKVLPGGFLDKTSSFDVDSEFSNSAELVQNILKHMKDSYFKDDANRDISDFSPTDFKLNLATFDQGSYVDKIKNADELVLIEMIKNEGSIKAFDEEVLRARDKIKDDPQLIAALENTMRDEVISTVAEHIDLDLLNNILGKDSKAIPTEELKKTVFGEFKSSIPTFDTESAFDAILPGFAQNSFDSDSLMDDLENEFGGSSLEESLSALPSVILDETDDEARFEPDNFDDILNKVSGTQDEDDFSQTVGGGKEEDPFAQNVSGGTDDANDSSLVKGQKEDVDDFMAKISGMDSDPDGIFATSFSNSDGDNKLGKFNVISGSPAEQKKSMNMFVKSNLDSNEELGAFDINVKAFVEKEAPAKISEGLEQFAAKLGKSLEKLSMEDLDSFQKNNVPHIMSELLQNTDEIEKFSQSLESPNEQAENDSSFQEKFKSKLEHKISTFENIAQEDGKYILNSSDLTNDEMKTIVQQTIKETFQDEFRFSSASPEEISKKENQLIKGLAQTLNIPEDELTTLVKGAGQLAKDQEKQFIADQIYNEDDSLNAQKTNSKVESELISRLKLLDEENKKLKTNLSALQLESSANANVKQKFEDIVNGSAGTSHDEFEIVKPCLSEVEKKQIVAQIKEGIPLDSEGLEKLSQSLENESKVIELAKKAENNLKKALFASEKKDLLFKQELTKAEKAIKAKEMVLEKAKESIRNLMGKKEKELLDFKGQVNDLNQKLKNDQSTQLKTEVKKLRSDKETLSKTAEVYKNKLESMAKNITKKAEANNGQSLADENRNLEKQKNQLENRMNIEMKSKQAIEEKLQTVRQSESKFKTDNAKAQMELKTAQSQLKLLKDQNAKLVKSATSNGSLDAGKISKEAEALKIKNNKLQEKLSVLTKKLEAQSSPVELGGIAVSDLSPQRAQQELEKSLKEVDLMRNQNQKLHSKIEELEKKHQDTPVVSVENSSFGKTLNKENNDTKTQVENNILEEKNAELSKKLEDMMAELQEAKLKAVPVVNANDNRLEKSVKKMSQDLIRANSEAAEKKKEAMKYKTEVTGLKNQMAKLKKDLEVAQKYAKGAKSKKAA